MSLFQSWPFWLVLVVLTFAVHETWALKTGNEPLTGYVRSSSKRFPIIIFALGMMVGWAAMHFWGAGWCG